MNVIQPPPQADPHAVAEALRSGTLGPALRESLAVLVVTHAAALRALHYDGDVVTDAYRASHLSLVLHAYLDVLQAAHREGL